MKTTPITVAIVEDSPGLTRNLEAIIRRDAGLKWVGSFADGAEAVQHLPPLKPSVVLMDINLPRLGGVECVERLSPDMPDTFFIMLTVFDDSDAIFKSLAAGAGGYLLKPVRAAQLIEAIHEIHEGGAPMSSNIARRVVQTFKKSGVTQEDNSDQGLTPRENEILDLLSKGLLQKEIAERLNISYWTVQTHIGRLYKKLHVNSSIQAVSKYLRKG